MVFLCFFLSTAKPSGADGRKVGKRSCGRKLLSGWQQHACWWSVRRIGPQRACFRVLEMAISPIGKCNFPSGKNNFQLENVFFRWKLHFPFGKWNFPFWKLHFPIGNFIFHLENAIFQLENYIFQFENYIFHLKM